MSHSSDGSSRKLKYVDPASFTPHFAWKKSEARGSFVEEVFCERVTLRSIGEKVGTPTYVYSQAAIEDAYHELDSEADGRESCCSTPNRRQNSKFWSKRRPGWSKKEALHRRSQSG